MKRFLALVLSFVIFAVPLAPFVQAAYENTQTEYFEDGSYMVMGSDEFVDREDAEDSLNFIGRIIEAIKKLINMLFGKSENKTKQDIKYVKYYDKNGTVLWEVYLEGTFSYNGEAARCTDASVSYYIYDGDWKMLSCESTKSGSVATASFKVRQYKLGVALKTIEKSIVLTCDKNGKTY